MVEKGFEVGVYILFGVVIELCVMNELFFNWKELGVFLNVLVKGDEVYFLISDIKGFKVFYFGIFKFMYNDGNYIVSLGNVCCWLVE